MKQMMIMAHIMDGDKEESSIPLKYVPLLEVQEVDSESLWK